MYKLEYVHAVQYFLIEAETLHVDGLTTGVIAPNGSGKSAILDAVQIVLLGGDQNAIRLNAQAGGDADGRSIREYCLGYYHESAHARDHATTYLTLVFRDTTAARPPVSVGIALGATINDPKLVVYGWYQVDGVALELADHIEATDEGKQPMAWATFKANVEARCIKQRDARVEFEFRSASAYLRSLLFLMRPDSAHDSHPDAFRKAFRNALNLTKVTDTDHFIRHLIAEERPINLERFREQLESFRELRRKIAEVITRIGALEAIQALYAKAIATRMHKASYLALAAEYRRDAHYDALEAGQHEVETTRATLDAALRVAEQAEGAARTAQATLMALTQEARDKPEFRHDHAVDETHVEKQTAFKKQLTQKLQRLADAFSAVERADPANGAWTAIARPWAGLLQRIRATSAAQALEFAPDEEEKHLTDTLPLLATQLETTKREAKAAAEMREHAEAGVKRLIGALQRAAEGRVQLRDPVMNVRRALEDAGIAATPVCDLTRITDPKWAAAIEAYLRSNVDALVIEPGHEDEAIAIYEAIPAGFNPFGVKLVTRERRAGSGSLSTDALAHLIEGTDERAVAYLRARLGRLRQLERATRDAEDGLTRTGMLVKDGSVERLWMPVDGELKIGQRDARDRRQMLASQKREADEALRAAQRHEDRYRHMVDATVTLSTARDAARDIADLLQEHRAVDALRAVLARSRREGMTPDLLELQAAIEAAQGAEAGARLAASQANEAKGRARQAAEQAESAWATLEQQSEALEREASQLFAEPHVDATWLDGKRSELEANDRSLLDRISWCQERIGSADKIFPGQQSAAWSELTRYGNTYQVTIGCTPDDLDAANKLLAGDFRRLRESELARYEREADDAYAVATKTFRTRIAAQLSSQFDDLRLKLRTLNAILERSPAFTNDERYHFKMMLAPEHKALYDFVVTVATRGGEDNMFEEAAHTPEAFRSLLEDSAMSQRTLLEDYRLFFTFDVEVRQHGVKITTLGARMRSGSGGEHRAPLFVVAGAALAAAYGKSQGDSTGLSLIVLDELGDKIDEENMRAVFEYLRGLGLQPLVAAPGLALGALSSSLDSYIELYRADDTLLIQHIRLKPAAHALLTSDLASVNSELLAAQIQAIQAERGAVS